jgi:hypothetical protein
VTVLLVTGGRSFCEPTQDGTDRDRDLYMDERRALGFALDYIKPSSIIVGDADGADRWAAIWAERRGVPCRVFKADWSQGKKAGPMRNDAMVRARPDAGLSFPGGTGTLDCTRRMEVAGIPVYYINVRPSNDPRHSSN